MELFFFLLLSTVGKSLLLLQFCVSQNRHCSQQQDQNSDQFSVLLPSWRSHANINGSHWSLICVQKFHSNSMPFYVHVFFISKADHHIVLQFEFCREIFLYLSLFFYFKARYLLLLLSVEGSQYLRPLQIHCACQQSKFLVKHTVLAINRNTMKNILV